MKFREIEHKFIVPPGFAKADFFTAVKNLRPNHETVVEVEDTYFVAEKVPGYIFRHRIDQELQQLTVKSFENPSNRLEVNLDLDLGKGNQREQIHAFLAPLGVVWSGTLKKKVNAFMFADCEIVYYSASYEGRSVCCVEFEALGCASFDEAQALLVKYENKLGFSHATREERSLFELLVLAGNNSLKRFFPT